MLICFDFDGVIHDTRNAPWGGPTVIDGPTVEDVKGLIIRLKDKGHQIFIFTARASLDESRIAVEKWLDEKGIPWDAVTRIKPSEASIFIDDRALCFDGNVKALEENIENFKPWTQRPKDYISYEDFGRAMVEILMEDDGAEVLSALDDTYCPGYVDTQHSCPMDFKCAKCWKGFIRKVGKKT